MKSLTMLLAFFLVTATAASNAEAPTTPTATLAFQLSENARGPFVGFISKGKPDKKCKGKGILSSISHGNPFSPTKNNEGFSIPAATPQKFLVVIAPSPAYLNCKWTVTFTPKENVRYTILSKYTQTGYDQRTCSVSVLEGDKPLADDLLQVDEC